MVGVNINKKVSSLTNRVGVENSLFENSILSTKYKDFYIKNMECKSFNLDANTGPIFVLELFEELSTLPENVNYLLVSCSLNQDAPTDEKLPQKFNIDFDGVNFNVAEMELIDCDTIPDIIQINGITIPTGRTATLTVLAGSK